MKQKAIDTSELENSDMLSEYDLSGKTGVRGKYYRAYRDGHTVEIEQPDEPSPCNTSLCRKAL